MVSGRWSVISLPPQRRPLGRETNKIDALLAKVREAIERPKELRTPLVSAVVTGKIDVRDAAAVDDRQITL